ncbi:MAG TPA: DKNYY domain-containing protein [Chryseolinea sp.]|nr:DKNYY domain-containing protein [Chryseolinea sp.]HPM29774.1 DKNYY domain-containing protein [Chryseolinea sp.]
MLIILGALALLFVLFIISFFLRVGKPVNAALSDSYYHHAWKNKIIYSPMGNWFELGYEETNADPQTFTVLAQNYGKDNKSVFWRGFEQAVDYASFYVDEHGTPKDNFKVYYDDHYQDSLLIVKGADPKTYRPYTLTTDQYAQAWYRDDYLFFVEGEKVDVDAKTFKRINNSLGIDSQAVYSIVRNELMSSGPGAVIVTKRAVNPGGVIQALSTDYGRVGNSIILSNWKNDFAMLTFKTIDSVVVINERNLSVDGVLVSDGKIIPEFDVRTFEEIDRDHFKDKAHIYYDGLLISDADVNTFKVLSEEYAKDAKHAFYKNKILSGVNTATFNFAFNTEIASDGNLSFKDGELIEKKGQ